MADDFDNPRTEMSSRGTFVGSGGIPYSPSNDSLFNESPQPGMLDEGQHEIIEEIIGLESFDESQGQGQPQTQTQIQTQYPQSQQQQPQQYSFDTPQQGGDGNNGNDVLLRGQSSSMTSIPHQMGSESYQFAQLGSGNNPFDNIPYSGLPIEGYSSVSSSLTPSFALDFQSQQQTFSPARKPRKLNKITPGSQSKLNQSSENPLLFDETVYEMPADPTALGASFLGDNRESDATGPFGLYTTHDYLEDSGILAAFETLLKELFKHYNKGMRPLNVFSFAADEFEKFGRSWQAIRRPNAERAAMAGLMSQVFEEELRRLYATIRVQAAYRGYAVRAPMKREKSAIKIQSMFKGHKVRRDLKRGAQQDLMDALKGLDTSGSAADLFEGDDDEFARLEASAARGSSSAAKKRPSQSRKKNTNGNAKSRKGSKK